MTVLPFTFKRYGLSLDPARLQAHAPDQAQALCLPYPLHLKGMVFYLTQHGCRPISLTRRAAALWPAAPMTLPAGWHPLDAE